MLYEKYKNGFTRLAWALSGITATVFFFPIHRIFHHGLIGEFFLTQETYEGIIAGGFSIKGWFFHLIPGFLTIVTVLIVFKIVFYVYGRLIRFVLEGFDEDMGKNEKKSKDGE